jgi:hypothetical protein
LRGAVAMMNPFVGVTKVVMEKNASRRGIRKNRGESRQ